MTMSEMQWQHVPTYGVDVLVVDDDEALRST